MYADDTSAATVKQITDTLINIELQSVLEWVISNRLVFNMSKTKSIIFWDKSLAQC
jgi:hypothetical protein